MNDQQKWDRYCSAINYCISRGILFNMEDFKGGNVRRIRAKWNYAFCVNSEREAVITLKPKKYKPLELYWKIIEQIGKPIWRKLEDE